MKRIFSFHFIFLITIFLASTTKTYAKNIYEIQEIRKTLIEFYSAIELDSEEMKNTSLDFSIFIDGAFAARGDTCFYGGWKSIEDSSKCMAPQKNIGYEACALKDHFRCNPDLFGGGAKGECVSLNKSKNITKKCEQATKENIPEVVQGFLKDPKKLNNIINDVNKYCKSKSNSSICNTLNTRLSEIAAEYDKAIDKQLLQENSQSQNRALGILDACQKHYEYENEGFFAKMTASDRNIVEGVKDQFSPCSLLSAASLNIVYEDFSDDLADIEHFVYSKEILSEAVKFDLDTNLKALLMNEIQYQGELSPEYIESLTNKMRDILSDSDLSSVFNKNIEEFKKAAPFIKQKLKKDSSAIASEFNKFGDELNQVCSEVKEKYKEVKDRGLVLNSKAENEFYQSYQSRLNSLYQNFQSSNDNSKLLATKVMGNDFLAFNGELAEKCAEDDIDLIYNSVSPKDINQSISDFSQMMSQSIDKTLKVAKVKASGDLKQTDKAIKEYLKYKPYLLGNLLEQTQDKENLAKYICKSSLDIYQTDELWNVAEIGLAGATIAAAGAAFFIPGIGPLVSAGLIAKVAAVGVIGAESVMAFRKYDDGLALDKASRIGLATESISVDRAVAELDRADSAKNWAIFDGAMAVVGSGAIGKVVKATRGATLVKSVPRKSIFDASKAYDLSRANKISNINEVKPDIDFLKLDIESPILNPNYKHFVSSYSDISLATHNGKKYFLKEINGPQMLDELNNFNTLNSLGIKTVFRGVTKSQDGRLFMVSDFVEGALAKQTVNGFITSGLDKTFKITNDTYKQIEDYKDALLKNGVEANDIQFLISKNGDVTLIDVDAYKFVGHDLSAEFRLGTKEYLKKVEEASKTVKHRLSDSDYLLLVNHPSDGISLAIKRDFDAVMNDKILPRSAKVLDDVSTIPMKPRGIVDDVTTIVQPKLPKVSKKDWKSKLDFEAAALLEKELKSIINKIEFALNNKQPFSQELISAHNDLIRKYHLALQNDGIKVRLVESNSYDTNPKLINIFVDAVEENANPVMQTYVRASKLFNGKYLTFSIVDNIKENASGFYSSSYKRVELGYDALVKVFKKEKSYTSLHELRHLLFDSKREADIPSLFHISFHGSSTKDLYGKLPADQKSSFYNSYMSAEELYTHASDVWNMSKNFDSKTMTNKLISILKMKSKVDGIVKLSQNSKDLAKSFIDRISIYKKYLPGNFKENYFRIVNRDAQYADIALIKSDKIVFHTGSPAQILEFLKDKKIREQFLKKIDEVGETIRKKVKIDGKPLTDFEYYTYTNLRDRLKIPGELFFQSELKMIEKGRKEKLFSQMDEISKPLIEEMRSVYFKEVFIKRAKNQLKELEKFATKQNEIATKLSDSISKGVSPIDAGTLLDELIAFGKQTRNK